MIDSYDFLELVCKRCIHQLLKEVSIAFEFRCIHDWRAKIKLEVFEIRQLTKEAFAVSEKVAVVLYLIQLNVDVLKNVAMLLHNGCQIFGCAILVETDDQID